MNDDPLGLDPETMRRLGYRTVDLLVDRLSDPEIPPLRRATPDEMAARLGGPAAGGARGRSTSSSRGSRRDVLPFMSRGDHPRFFAFIPSAGTWPGALGDFIASALQRLRGLVDGVGRPEPARARGRSAGSRTGSATRPRPPASLVSGGSAANMTALACAREALVGSMSDDLVVYVSDQAHSSIARAARVLGFRPDQVRVLPVGRRSTGSRRDSSRPRSTPTPRPAARPLLVVGERAARRTPARSTRCRELAAICRERGVWLHVDAAYGGFAVLTERGRDALAGIELADSITLDPHKWLYQPFECGCLLVRDGRALRRAFEITPDYLRDADGATRRGELRRPRPAADAHVARVQGLALAPLLRARRVPRRDRPLASTSPRSPARASRRATSSSCSRRRRSASSASAGASTTPDDERLDRLNAELVAALERQRARPRLVDPAARPLRDPPVRPQPHEPARRTSSACSRSSSRPRSERRPRAARPLRAAPDVTTSWLQLPPPGRSAAASTLFDWLRPTTPTRCAAAVRAEGRRRRDDRRAVGRPQRDFFVIEEGVGRRDRRRRASSRSSARTTSSARSPRSTGAPGFALPADRQPSSRARRPPARLPEPAALGTADRRVPGGSSAIIRVAVERPLRQLPWLRRRIPTRPRHGLPEPRAPPRRARVRRLQRRRVGRLDRDARLRVRAGRRDDGRARRARAARARRRLFAPFAASLADRRGPARVLVAGYLAQAAAMARDRRRAPRRRAAGRSRTRSRRSRRRR